MIFGFDINTNEIEIAERTVGIKQAIDFGSYDFDVYVISVSTHKSDMFSPQIDALMCIAGKISEKQRKMVLRYQ